MLGSLLGLRYINSGFAFQQAPPSLSSYPSIGLPYSSNTLFVKIMFTLVKSMLSFSL